MDSTFNGDFARLVPHNDTAKRLFSTTYIFIEKESSFHVRFLEQSIVTGGTSRVPAKPVESGTDFDSQSENETRVSQMEVAGSFILSFDQKRGPEFPKLGWRVGRGTSGQKTRGVDLLLSKPRIQLGMSLANVHMIFHFNPQSGLLMLRGGSSKKPVEYRSGDKWVELAHDEARLLYELSLRIKAGECEYELEHIVAEKHRASYFKRRNIFFRGPAPENDEFKINDFKILPLERLPGDICIVRGRYLELGTRGFGGFGWITQGLDIKTGNLVAIKEMRVKAGNEAEIMAEARMGSRFTNEPGLLPTLHTICEHGQPEICCKLERFFIFMPSAISDFTGAFWRNTSISRLAKLQLLKEPLEGLKTLHDMGIMHRDIKINNMLITSNDPPCAALCDFGKAVKTETSDYKYIGPVYTCAPEVLTATKEVPYTAKIDTWAYGYAIAEVLGYKLPRGKPEITQERLASILKYLYNPHFINHDDKLLVDLVSKLLVWEPKDRWSAEQALRHECWLPIAQEQDPRFDDLAEPSTGKKRLLEDPRSDSQQPAHDYLHTQAFSPETQAELNRKMALNHGNEYPRRAL